MAERTSGIAAPPSKHERGERLNVDRPTLFTTKRGAALVLLCAVIVAALVAGSPLLKSGHTTTKTEEVVKIHLTNRYGKILVTPAGYTIYTYNLDTKNHSNCYAFCLHLWPPLVVSNGVQPVGHGVSNLGAITRSGGLRQVTYKGKPLYIFVFDHIPGRISGEGNGWSVVHIP
jgi:predicted lipoprotein with Yx(FWY)xxD motif